ncbi:hypothetical protein CONCODRAFT_11497 [Conidiobolus coronatus NRRL 28638]|uniref:RNI-like protein n=1 Tax=Conidiobolus coronatus (strain ATCC 28846 / CBS 209.66 / NRRL 28638) TaxID=796925 RepID=A0A137NVJ3_CONC2|nr:hypothetical protein CONCODRAFT_11497 [Conidiobolus coronatus NRRL 28638]|eukprot:KXN66614.1 hypothetical protein CONCODRAFT_11497 [Conidiobolus coronatus NRRL 28638]
MTTSNPTKNISWELIFKLYDMQLYLSKFELNEIALISKQIYNELKPSIFSSININDLNANQISKVIDVRKPGFNLNYIESLRIESILGDSFSSLIASLSNISSLTLSNQQLDLKFINSIFSNLTKLNNLKLNQVNIEFNLSLVNSNELKLPLTVRKLSISDCSSFIYTDKCSEGVRRDTKTLNTSNCAYSTISNLKFHNLKQLSIKSAIMHSSHLIENPYFNSYLVNNPNLTSLSVEMSKLNDESLALMLNLKSLTHLKIIGRNYNFQNTSVNLGKNYSLRSFHLNYTMASYHTDIILGFVKYCSNIEQLTVDYSEFIASKIDQIIAGLPNLNKLTIIKAGCMQIYLKLILTALKI